MNPLFGPRSRPGWVLDPIIGNPSLTEIGRNVVFGYGSAVTRHPRQRDAIAVKRVAIGDDVLIGAQATIFSGCRIRRGAVILAGPSTRRMRSSAATRSGADGPRSRSGTSRRPARRSAAVRGPH